jgi:hypothetical protein
VHLERKVQPVHLERKAPQVCLERRAPPMCCMEKRGTADLPPGEEGVVGGRPRGWRRGR